jgi:hypothetical protein
LGLKYLFIYGMMEMIGRFIVVEEMKFLKPWEIEVSKLLRNWWVF